MERIKEKRKEEKKNKRRKKKEQEKNKNKKCESVFRGIIAFLACIVSSNATSRDGWWIPNTGMGWKEG